MKKLIAIGLVASLASSASAFSALGRWRQPRSLFHLIHGSRVEVARTAPVDPFHAGEVAPAAAHTTVQVLGLSQIEDPEDVCVVRVNATDSNHDYNSTDTQIVCTPEEAISIECAMQALDCDVAGYNVDEELNDVSTDALGKKKGIFNAFKEHLRAKVFAHKSKFDNVPPVVMHPLTTTVQHSFNQGAVMDKPNNPKYAYSLPFNFRRAQGVIYSGKENALYSRTGGKENRAYRSVHFDKD